MKAKALYVGSFDPVTLGHMDIIARACAMFEYVEVAIGDNPNKKYMFSFDERVALMEKSLSLLGKSASGKVGLAHTPICNLTADHARIFGFDIIIKGARTSQDFDYEKLIHEVSLTQQRNIETILMFSSSHLGHVSSSAAKELAKYQGLVHGYVPIHVKAAMEEKLDQRIIGVTGTIGSGKSTFCKNLATPRVHHVSMDDIGHELLTSDLPIAKETRHKLEERFGSCSRKELGDMVFANKDALSDLNSIYRDPMLTLLRERLLGLKGTILLEGALLAEMDWLFLCNNNVIVVKTPSSDAHINRLMRRGLDVEQITRRLNSQYTFEEKVYKITNRICSDVYGRCVIYNTETCDTTARDFVLGNT